MGTEEELDKSKVSLDIPIHYVHTYRLSPTIIILSQ